jgi:hypothetical protein
VEINTGHMHFKMRIIYKYERTSAELQACYLHGITFVSPWYFLVINILMLLNIFISLIMNWFVYIQFIFSFEYSTLPISD